MHRGPWRKPLHTRKIWKQQHLIYKTIYYMKPFADDLLCTWLKPLPYPTIFKISYSVVLCFLLLMPIIYPTVLLLLSYLEFQFLFKRHFDLQLPTNWDLLNYLENVIKFEINCDAHRVFLMLYFERLRITGLTILSVIDYLRLLFFIYFGQIAMM